MKLQRTDAGFTIDAADLAPLLALPVGRMRELMRSGAVTSRFERGEAEDAGRFRVTFFHGRSRLQLTVDGDGWVLRQSRVTWSAPPPAADRER